MNLKKKKKKKEKTLEIKVTCFAASYDLMFFIYKYLYKQVGIACIHVHVSFVVKTH